MAKRASDRPLGRGRLSTASVLASLLVALGATPLTAQTGTLIGRVMSVPAGTHKVPPPKVPGFPVMPVSGAAGSSANQRLPDTDAFSADSGPTSGVEYLVWGVRGHTVIDRVAVRTIPVDGPQFLRGQEEWIAYQAIIPDLWRRPSEPFLKIVEDPNHHWYREQLEFMHEIPRSRYEFVLAVYDEYRRLLAAGDTATAALTNVHWTGTLPYAAVENYERMVPAMRRYRTAHAAGDDTRFIELEIASYMARLGHYIGDGAQPLHTTVHHNGWVGDNPQGYATDRGVHGRFESRFVNAMEFEPADVQNLVPPATVLTNPIEAVLAHLDTSAAYVGEVYRLDRDGALVSGSNSDAHALALRQLSRAAALLRDLAYTAWVQSGEPVDAEPRTNATSPTSPSNPRYNPATGSAPAPQPPGSAPQ